jgi:hypothetical protein
MRQNCVRASPRPQCTSQVPESRVASLAPLLTPQESAYVAQARDAGVRTERLLAKAFVRQTLTRYLPHTAPQQVCASCRCVCSARCVPHVAGRTW